MALDSRKEQLLKLIIETYIDTAEPVGSQFLVLSGKLDVSGATVRNVMRELEEEGYLTHPHTSAGRIPTEAGYQYYIKNLINKAEPKKAEITRLKGASKRDGLKGVGKEIADMTENAVIIAFDNDSVYYTGISNLFVQPEFQNYTHTVQMSEVFDHCEEHIEDLYALAEKDQVQTLVGSANPLGNVCGTIVARLGSDALIIMVGPMRMNYELGMRIAKTIQDII